MLYHNGMVDHGVWLGFLSLCSEAAHRENVAVMFVVVGVLGQMCIFLLNFLLAMGLILLLRIWGNFPGIGVWVLLVSGAGGWELGFFYWRSGFETSCGCVSLLESYLFCYLSSSLFIYLFIYNTGLHANISIFPPSLNSSMICKKLRPLPLLRPETRAPTSYLRQHHHHHDLQI